jgi:bilin biosynthesis protein
MSGSRLSKTADRLSARWPASRLRSSMTRKARYHSACSVRRVFRRIPTESVVREHTLQFLHNLLTFITLVQGDEIVARLMKLLVLEDVHERRAAVQALGMIGEKVLPPLIDELLKTDDRLVRASCAKAIGAVALKNPELLPDFPQSALDGMKKAILDIPDPVTKIATVSSLGQIGGGDTAHGYPGCERALDVLCEALSVTEDMGLAAAAVNAVATIGQSNPPFRAKAVASLTSLKERAGEVDGFMFVEQMIGNHIENLSGGGLVGEMNKGRAGGDTGALSNLAAQLARAQTAGALADASAPPPVDEDWMAQVQQ